MIQDTPEGGYAGQRVSYTAGQLIEDEMAADPLAQFERWYADAVQAGIPEPNALVLATAQPQSAGLDGAGLDGAGLDGAGPTVRTVLLKQAGQRGFVFYTNYGSRKARQIEAGDGRVALVFPWHPMQRQVSALGTAARVPAEESRAYFGTRPWASRIGAWVSHQSQPLAGREELERRFAELSERWPDHGRPDDVPVPAHWGGFLVRAHEVEFWQGRPSRLHDRVAYLTAHPDAPADLDAAPEWTLQRRYP